MQKTFKGYSCPAAIMLIYGIASAVSILSISIMISWWVGSLTIPQLLSDQQPMVFNTALAFLFLSIALIGRTLKWRLLPFILSGLILFYFILLLAQYYFSTNWRLETIFTTPIIFNNKVFDLHMSPHAILVLSLTSLCIFIESQSADHRQFPKLLLGLAGSLMFIIGLVAVIGYVEGLRDAYTWERYVSLAFSSALACIFLGIIIVVYACKCAETTPLWISVLTGVVPLFVAVFLTLAVTKNDDHRLSEKLQIDVNYIAYKFEEQLFDLWGAFGRMGSRWIYAHGTQREHWEHDAQSYLKSFPYLLGLDWIDPKGQLRWRVKSDHFIEPTKNQIKEAFDTALLSGHSQNISILSQAETNHWIQLMIVPLHFDSYFDGVLIAYICPQLLLDNIKSFYKKDDAYWILRQKDQVIYMDQPQQQAATIQWTKSSFFRVSENYPELKWEITVMPSLKFIASNRSLLPYVVFIFGLSVSILVLLSVFYVIKWKKTMLDLQEKDGQIQSFVEETAEGIIVLNHRGQIETFNSACEKLFGYHRDEILNQSIDLLLPEIPDEEKNDNLDYSVQIDSSNPVKVLVNLELSRGSRYIEYIENIFFFKNPTARTFTQEIKARKKDGSDFILSLSVSRFLTKTGTMFSAILRDVTEIKKTEQIRNELISVVSHELRTPITSIRGALGMIVGPLKDEISGRIESLATIAYRNSERLVRIVNDILDIEKVLAGKLMIRTQPIDLVPFLKNVIEDAQFIESGRSINFILRDGEDQQVQADPDRLSQILMNLLSNAAKFSPDHSEVHIFTEKKGASIRIYVQDKGIGIPIEFRSRIFQRFSQADSSSTRRYVGAGLGLSITKDLVEAMQGRLDFVSIVGKGTTFFFDLPAA